MKKAIFILPMSVSVYTTIRKVYIHTVNDNAISYAAQQYMAKADKVAKVYSLPASHTPFISMPDKLAAILMAETK